MADKEDRDVRVMLLKLRVSIFKLRYLRLAGNVKAFLPGTPRDERLDALLKRLEDDYRKLKFLVQHAGGLGL